MAAPKANGRQLAARRAEASRDSYPDETTALLDQEDANGGEGVVVVDHFADYPWWRRPSVLCS